MIRKTTVGAVLVVSMTLATLRGADVSHPPDAPHGATTAAHEQGAAAQHAYTHPVVRAEPSPGAGVTMILILALFFAAAIIGPIVRYHAPEAPPEPAAHHDAHAHDAHGHQH